MQPIRTVLADDHQVVRSGIRSELQKHTDILVVGEATDGVETLQQVSRLQPDVLLLDTEMPRMHGIEVAERLYKGDGIGGIRPNILVLSEIVNADHVPAMFAVGVKGFLTKGEPLHRIIQGIRQVASGEPALSVCVQMTLLNRKLKPRHSLTSRELEVLKLLAQGYSNDRIGQSLVLADGTVKNHICSIYRKIPEVQTRAEAVSWAWRNRIIQV